jgi:hypothetical protein
MPLTRHDFSTQTWRAIREKLVARLDELRRQNDSPSLDIAKTAALRGRIAEVHRMLDWPAALERDADRQLDVVPPLED